jgi:hypothetical protein
MGSWPFDVFSGHNPTLKAFFLAIRSKPRAATDDLAALLVKETRHALTVADCLADFIFSDSLETS